MRLPGRDPPQQRPDRVGGRRRLVSRIAPSPAEIARALRRPGDRRRRSAPSSSRGGWRTSRGSAGPASPARSRTRSGGSRALAAAAASGDRPPGRLEAASRAGATRRGPGRRRVGAVDPEPAARGGAGRSGRSSGRGARPRTRRRRGRARPLAPSASRSSASPASRPSDATRPVRRVEDEAAPALGDQLGQGAEVADDDRASPRRTPRGRRSRTSRRPATARPRRAPPGTGRRRSAASSRPSKWTLSSPAGLLAQLGLVLARAGDPQVEAGQAAHRVDGVLEPLDLLQPARRGDVGPVVTRGGARRAGRCSRAGRK